MKHSENRGRQPMGKKEDKGFLGDEGEEDQKRKWSLK